MHEHEHTPTPSAMVAAFGAGQPLTMSSREIADMCEKRHPDVRRDIRAMMEGLEEDVSKFAHTYLDVSGRQQEEYLLPKDMTLTLASGYNVRLRKRIVDLWLRREEEKRSGGFALPRTYEEALEGLLAQVKRNTALAAANEEKDAAIGAMLPKVAEYEAYLAREGVVLIRDFCNKHGVKVRHPGYVLRVRHMMHQKKALATQVGIKAGIIRNIVDPEGFEYENSKGDMIESQSAMIVKEREADLLQMILDDYGQTAFRNPTAFQQAKMLLSGGGLA